MPKRNDDGESDVVLVYFGRGWDWGMAYYDFDYCEWCLCDDYPRYMDIGITHFAYVSPPK